MLEKMIDNPKLVAFEMRLFSPELRAQEVFLTNNSVEISKHLKEICMSGNSRMVTFMKRFKSTQLVYTRINKSTSFFDKKRFSPMMPTDEILERLPRPMKNPTPLPADEARKT